VTDQQIDHPTPRRWTRGRLLAWAAVLLMAAMWAYVLYLAIVPGRQPPPDRLGHPAFATQAQAICSAAHDDIDALPPAISEDDPITRAEVVSQANARFATMLDDLEAIAPSGEDGNITLQWIADWRTYLGDRAAYAEALRTDPDARLLVTAKDQQQITEFIDAFSADNRMIACATPIDV
jgi:hypothetical protein